MTKLMNPKKRDIDDYISNFRKELDLIELSGNKSVCTEWVKAKIDQLEKDIGLRFCELVEQEISNLLNNR